MGFIRIITLSDYVMSITTLRAFMTTDNQLTPNAFALPKHTTVFSVTHVIHHITTVTERPRPSQTDQNDPLRSARPP